MRLEWWALRHVTEGYVLDLCAGGAFTRDIAEAVVFPTPEYAVDIPREGFEAVLVKSTQ